MGNVPADTALLQAVNLLSKYREVYGTPEDLVNMIKAAMQASTMVGLFLFRPPLRVTRLRQHQPKIVRYLHHEQRPI